MSLRPSSRPAHCGPRDRLAAAVGDDRGAALQVDVGNGQDFGRRIDQDRDVLRLAICAIVSSAIGPCPGRGRPGGRIIAVRGSSACSSSSIVSTVTILTPTLRMAWS